MPTYEYKCDDCGFIFEEFQQIASEPLKICPRCGGEIQRVIYGGVGLHFKGSGFYLTDYAKKKTSGTVKKERTSSDKTTSK